MIRFASALTIAAGLLALAGASAAEAREIKVKRAAPAKTATVAPAKPADVAPAPVVATIPACARKVKVIYAGYGEADRATCTQSAMDTASPTAIATR